MTHVSVRQGLLYISLAATAWGTGGAAGALLDRAGGVGPVAVSFWRFAVGATMILLVTRILGVAIPRHSALGRAVVLGVAMAVCQTAYFAAIAESGLAVATVVTTGATPVFVAAGSAVLLRERPGAAGLGCVAAALAGLALLASDDGPAGFSPAGAGWALLSAAGYAGVTLLNRARPAEPYSTAMGGFAVGAACLLPVALAHGMLPSGEQLASWALIAYLGAIPTALAYGLFFAGLAAVRAMTASVITLVEPVGAAALGVLLFGERLSPQAAGGAALLLAAVVLLALGERKEAPNPA
ncbi:DMT family transporter [Planobispora longispora]|uniref:Membrane protein n=1 Tax=Planobispora longispora TaxID=28887 RepID=A0A8J3RQE3_9ACTN|nr:EamA family transporter [Planobispora longispora]BFE82764.1 EamA family transporter [Planobispora longispora]GIH77997.1 membrane protein [Planobispora longispora]